MPSKLRRSVVSFPNANSRGSRRMLKTARKGIGASQKESANAVDRFREIASADRGFLLQSHPTVVDSAQGFRVDTSDGNGPCFSR